MQLINRYLKKWPLLWENFQIATHSIRANMLRSVLTIVIIGLGITALVGTLTAIDALKASISENFARMGSSTFSIENQGLQVRMGNRRERRVNNPEITYQQATEFKKRYQFPAFVSISASGSQTAIIKYAQNKTNPNVRVMGINEHYLQTAGVDLGQGRNFSFDEANTGNNIAIIGSEVRKKLFSEKENPLGKIIIVDGARYRVIGVTESKGESINNSDRIVYLPIQNVRQHFARPNMNFRLQVTPVEFSQIETAVDEAEGTFRMVRKLSQKDESDFSITRSDSLSGMLIQNLSMVSVVATVVAIITLINAAIGLTNIMLVAVAERTREIGTRKAIGANSRLILQQFLFEAIVIGQLGGALGIVVGIALGNLLALALGSSFLVPWGWMLLGVFVCLVVGLAAGIMPAMKAAKLDPIEALRYE